MTFSWDDLRLFLSVAETGSLSAAARELRLGQPTLSRRIAEMEAEIQENLFTRDSQGMHLTEAGLKLLPAAKGMADWAQEAESAVQHQKRKPEGLVRIAAPPGIAFELVAPLAARIRKEYPAIQIEALSGVPTLNLARGEADISLRTTKPQDADLFCLDEATGPVRAYASADYAANLPESYSLADLDWICWPPQYDHLQTNQALRKAMPGFRPAFTSDDFNVQLAACRAGVGVMPLVCALHRYSRITSLTDLNLDLGQEASGTLYLVVHKRHRYLPKVSVVLDFLHQEFAYLRGEN